jgi:hypothetical protein
LPYENVLLDGPDNNFTVINVVLFDARRATSFQFGYMTLPPGIMTRLAGMKKDNWAEREKKLEFSSR